MKELANRLASLSPAKRALLQKAKSATVSSDLEEKSIPPRSADEIFPPLSFAQQRLWFLNQLEGSSATYNMPAAIRLNGLIDFPAFEAVFQEILNRHEVLRTNFIQQNGRPVQLIHAERNCYIPIIDLQSVPESQRQAEFDKLAAQEAQRPFDLAQDNLLRLSLVRFDAEQHVLLINIHHIISDGWSNGNVLLREVSALYSAFSQGQASPLPPLPIQYADFACWQRDWLSGTRLDSQLAYWKQQLSGIPALLELPTDRPRPAIQTFTGDVYYFNFDKQLLAQLKALGQANGATLFMTLQAGFAALLARYSRQNTVVMGSPIANRNRKELEPLIGFFVNTLVLRTEFADAPSANELLAQVRATCLDAYRHQDVPFERLVEAIKPERNLSFSTLFQVMFILQNQNEQTTGMRIGNLHIATLPQAAASSMFDMTLKLEEVADGLSGEFEYNTDLFDKATIARVVEHYRTLLTGLVNHPDCPVAQLPLLKDADRQQLLSAWNATQRDYPFEQTVCDLFERQVQQYPDRIALQWEDQQLSYLELSSRAETLASYLQGLGVVTDTLVGLCLNRSVDMLVGLLGIMKAGAAYVPLDPAYPRERLQAMISSSGLSLLLAQQTTADALPACNAHIVYLDKDWTSIAATPPRLVSNAASYPDSLAYVIYTSGSTGLPKGVQISHRALLNFLLSMSETPSLCRDDVLLAVTTISFDIAGLELYLPLIMGARIALVSRETAADGFALLQALHTSQATVMQATPATWRLLFATESPLPLQRVFCGGEALSSELASQLLSTGAEVWNLYGPTETTVWSTASQVPSQTAKSSRITIGQPIGNTQTYILDAFFQPVPLGIPGELYIGGLGVSRGYLGQPAMTAERFLPDPFANACGYRLYRTGDLVRFLNDGQISFLGRVDHQVKIRGFRIELGEIEAVLTAHPAVNTAVAICREDRQDQQQLVAYLQANPEWLQEQHKTDSSEIQVEKWQTVWEQTYQSANSERIEESDFSGWLSSYTGKQIPDQQMQAWVNETVERILTLKPQRVMEIGCGAGLLLSRIAPKVQCYVGTDFSASVLQRLQQRLNNQAISGVQLLQREASTFAADDSQRFDTIILNSVIQYFPNVDYLLTVLEGAVNAISDGGCLFLGDLRTLSLLELQHVSVQFYQAADACTCQELAQKVSVLTEREEELLLDPDFFVVLKKRLPRIAAVEFFLKHGADSNEMVKFRYDAVLRIDTVATIAVPEMYLRNAEGQLLNPQELKDWLLAAPEALLVKNLPNQRLLEDVKVQEWLHGDSVITTVAEMRSQLQGTPLFGIEPCTLCDIANALGYTVALNWAAENPRKLFDAVFYRQDSQHAHRGMIFTDTDTQADNLKHYANNPVRNVNMRLLISELRNYLESRLPAYMVPSAIVCMDSLPLTPNGKIDRRALPAPDATVLKAEYSAPQTADEERLAEIWAEILEVDKVGRNDNFFSLGGHSLLGVQVISKIRDIFAVELPIQALFDAPTIALLNERFLVAALKTQAVLTPIPVLTQEERNNVPLSFAQQRLWFLDKLEGANATYHISCAVRLSGKLNLDALERAFKEIVRRHEALRTHFSERDGNPIQNIGSAESFQCHYLVLDQLPVALREAEIQSQLSSESQKPFDLAQDGLLRVSLLRLQDNMHILLLTMHHIISDEWSMGLLLQESATLYHAFSLGHTSPLPDLPVQYADYAHWQRQWLSGDVLKNQLSYWTGQLAGAPALLNLPTDRPRPAVQQYRGRSLSFVLDGKLTAGLKQLGQSSESTLFMVLLAGYGALLARYTNGRDVVIGSPIANRNRSELEALIGFFVNTLPLRLDLSGNPDSYQLLTRIRQTALAAYTNQDVPFEYIVEALQPERSLSHAPLFQVMFVLQNAPRPDMSVAGLKLEMLDTESLVAKFDLTLSIEEVAGELQGVIEYNTDLFDTETILCFSQHYRQLLSGMAATPDKPVLALPVLSKAEQQKIVHDWNTLIPHTSLPCTVQQLIETQAELSADKPALVHGESMLTYAALNQQANRVAHQLRKTGIGCNTLVGLYVEPSFEMIIGLLAILKAGAAYLPLMPETPAERLAFILEETQTPLILTHTRLSASIADYGAQVLCINELSKNNAPHTNLNLSSHPDDLAYVIYTSGSTGQPKGVQISIGNLAYATDARLKQYQTAFTGPLLQPFAFDIAGGVIFWSLCQGGCLYLEPRNLAQDPQQLLERLAQTQATHLLLLPLLYTSLLDLATPSQLANLQTVVLGGEQMPVELGVRHATLLPWTQLFNEYGPTEATIWCSCFRIDNDLQRSIVPIGRPTANSQIYLLDEHLNPVPVGVSGELYVGGAQVSRGYLNQAVLTGEKFIPDIFNPAPGARLYRTGDIARYRNDGNIEFQGRVDQQVKVRGFRIELGEIEAALKTYSGVHEAAVVINEQNGKRLVAYLVSKNNSPDLMDNLREHLRSKLPDYMIPGVFMFLDSLPQTANGKLDLHALPAPEQNSLSTAYRAPRTPTERVLTDIWQEVLGLTKVGIEDNFFNLGGDSILSIQIVSRASRAGIGLTVKQLFQHQTIAELARVAPERQAVHAQQGTLAGAFALTPVQTWFFAGNSPEPHYFNQSVLLKLVSGLAPDILERAIHALIMHHDMLRARFHQQSTVVHAEIVGSCGALPLQIYDYSPLSVEQQTAALFADATQQQTSLNLSEGPLLRVVFYQMGHNQPDRLLLILHHLIIDGVSWRILLSDLDLVLSQLLRAEPIALPAKTTEFPYWSKRLCSYADSEQSMAELDYWQEQTNALSARLPVDRANDIQLNTLDTAEHVTLTLAADKTQALLLETPRAYRCQINDVLLTALLRTFHSWTGQECLRIIMEGHGREELFDDVDLSRTVGWFTSGFPVVLNCPAENSIAASLKQVKETLRSIPKHGIGFGILRYLSQDDAVRASLDTDTNTEISFNYLGRFEQNSGSSIFLGEASEPVGSDQSQKGIRRFVLEVNGIILNDGCLQMTWTYSNHLHQQQTIASLAQQYFTELASIIAHCQTQEAGGYTASDFPLVRKDQAMLDGLFQRWGLQVEDVYPLSPMQQGMLFHSLYDQTPGAYVLQMTGRILGAFQPAQFRRAWQRVLDRHPSLRTAILTESATEPVQVVINKIDLPWLELNWSESASDQQQERLQALLHSDRMQGFNVDETPLMRIILIKLQNNAWQFIWSHHHLLTDGWCLPILIREVMHFYHAFVEQCEQDLVSQRPYRDYIAWLQEQDLQQAEAFWKENLRGFAAPTSFGVDHVLNAGSTAQLQAADYQEYATELDANTSQALQDLAHSHSLTLSILTQGVWGILLSIYSGTQDVVFGTTVSGRPPEIADVDTMVGLFINTLPVRIRLQGEQSLLDYFRQLRDDQLARDSYAYTPLVNIHACSELSARQPLFESIVVFENYPMDSALDASTGTLSFEDMHVLEQNNFPLTLTAASADKIPLKISYDSKRFDESSIQRMLNHLCNLLTALSAEPQQSVSQWCRCLLSADERKQLQSDFNQTQITSVQPQQTFSTLFETQVARTPARTAVVFAEQQLSYDGLNRRANQIAHQLRALGVKPGVLVALYMERSLEMLAGLLGIQKAGGAYLPLDPAYPAQRLAFMLEDSQVGIILTQPDLRALLPETRAQIVLLTEDFSDLASFSSANPLPWSGAADLAYLIYTSGSTGKPKGVQISHGALLNFLLSMMKEPGMTEDDILLAVTTLSFDIATLELYLPLLAGAKLILVSREVAGDGLSLLGEIQRHSVSIMQATPVTWRILLEAGWQGAPLCQAFCGGEGLPLDLSSRMCDTGVKVWNLYGPTETTVWSSAHAIVDHHYGYAYESIGRPIDNTQLYVVDRSYELTPMGVPGELLIGGDGLAYGYFHRPGLTAEKFIPNPFDSEPGRRLYCTGDLVRYHDDGNLICLGRIDQQIKIRGFRIELGEIEALISQCQGIKQVAVSVWNASADDKRLVAYLIAENDAAIDTDAVRNQLRGQLPVYMIPAEWVWLEHFPRTPNGKLDRAALPAPNRQQRDSYQVASTATEEKLIELMAEVLSVDRLGADDDFFELGGHSLLAAKLLVRILHTFQINVPMPVLFQNSNVVQLASYIDTTLWAAQQGMMPEMALQDDEEEFRL